MLIYLRHGDDRGDDVYRHDRPLNERGREKAVKAARRLIEKRGHPDTCYVSPFRRALETLECMSVRFERPVTVHRDPRIAQCLSEKQRRDPQISPQTRAQITIDEDPRMFRQRVALHVAEARVQSGVVWCITHQAVIEEVTRHFQEKISRSFDFLDHAVMLG